MGEDSIHLVFQPVHIARHRANFFFDRLGLFGGYIFASHTAKLTHGCVGGMEVFCALLDISTRLAVRLCSPIAEQTDRTDTEQYEGRRFRHTRIEHGAAADGLAEV
jgi:hypothetical protein